MITYIGIYRKRKTTLQEAFNILALAFKVLKSENMLVAFESYEFHEMNTVENSTLYGTS